MHGWMMSGDGGWQWSIMVLTLAALWALLIALAFAFAGLLRGDGGRSREPLVNVDSADVILRERFARGEIDRDEFDRRRRSLTG